MTKIIPWNFLTALVVGALMLLFQNQSLVDFLQRYYDWIIGLHILAVILGVGGATYTDIFFFRFLKDSKIEESEANILNVFTKVIWWALTLFILSGISLYLLQPEFLASAPKFITKMVIVAIIVINGLVLNYFIGPNLTVIRFDKFITPEVRKLRRLAFASGGVSFLSWYSAFFLGAASFIDLPVRVLLGIYLVLAVGAVTGGLLAEAFLHKKVQ